MPSLLDISTFIFILGTASWAFSSIIADRQRSWGRSLVGSSFGPEDATEAESLLERVYLFSALVSALLFAGACALLVRYTLSPTFQNTRLGTVESLLITLGTTLWALGSIIINQKFKWARKLSRSRLSIDRTRAEDILNVINVVLFIVGIVSFIGAGILWPIDTLYPNIRTVADLLSRVG